MDNLFNSNKSNDYTLTEEKIAAKKDELNNPEYASMYSKLTEIQGEIDALEESMLELMEQWNENDMKLQEFSV